MGVRSRIWRCGAAIALIATGPAVAWAHAGERGFVLLMPRGYALWGGTFAVAASFLVLLAIPDAPIRRFAAAGIRLGRLPTMPAPWLSALSFALMLALIAAGLTGTRDPLENPLPLTVWTLWWGGLTAAHAVFGNLWAVLNPWIAPYRLLRAFLRLPETPLAYPRWLGHWPAIALFLAFAWFELVHPAPDDPARLALAVGAYAAITLLGMLLFGERAWLTYAEAFSVFFRFVSLLAPVQADRDRGVTFVPPGAGLVRHGPLGASGALFLLLMLATVSFDGLSKTFWWLGLGGINPLEFPGRTAVMGRNSLGLLLSWAALSAAFGIAAALGCRLARAPAASCFGGFVLSILPIALAYHLAHYLPAFLINAQYALAALGDPFGLGWNLLGLAERHPVTSFLADYHSVAVLWTAQSGLIVLGHILAVLVAHAIALERFGTGRAAFMSQLPLALLMIAYTAFGLWLLSAPTAG
ncbi:MAG TPA: hypothetical protein VF031_09725 [Alphaproteobacteria bacterium]